MFNRYLIICLVLVFALLRDGPGYYGRSDMSMSAKIAGNCSQKTTECGSCRNFYFWKIEWGSVRTQALSPGTGNAYYAMPVRAVLGAAYEPLFEHVISHPPCHHEKSLVKLSSSSDLICEF